MRSDVIADWHNSTWDETLAAWDARSQADLLRFDQIAELHAVHRLGAVFPERDGRVPTPGYDVLHAGRKVEVKAKEPSRRSPSRLYVEVQLAKKVSDRFWFYVFGHAVGELVVWDVATAVVFANLSTRNGTAIPLSRVEQVGRCIWKDGHPVARNEHAANA